jgi:hypothetical protein
VFVWEFVIDDKEAEKQPGKGHVNDDKYFCQIRYYKVFTEPNNNLMFLSMKRMIFTSKKIIL